MRKYIYIAILFLLCAGRASAQFTLVSGTVTDANGIAYSCGSLSASIVNNNGQSLYLNGVQFSPQPGATKLGCPTDATTSTTPGAFTVQLADNTQIKCGSGASIVTCATQTQWLFTVNSTGILPPLGTGPQTCTATLTISGSSQTISSSFSACPALSVTSSSTVPNLVSVTAAPYGAKFDGLLAYDVSCTLNSPVVTCPNNDCNFTPNMAGRESWVVNNNGCNAGLQCVPIIGTVGSAPPTVLTVGGPQSITLSANANANCVAACAIIVSDDDTTPITNAYNAASLKCGTMQMPPGISIVNSAIFGNTPTNCSIFAAVGSRQMTTVQGAGASSTILVPSINFNMASCGGGVTGACFGVQSNNAHGLTLKGFTVYGMGLNMGASANNTTGIQIGANGQNFSINDVELMHWNAGSTGSSGLTIGGGTTILENVQVDGMNNFACTFGSQVYVHGHYFCGDSPVALQILNGSTVSTFGGTYCATGNPTVQLGINVTWNSFGEQSVNCASTAGQKFINGSNMTVSLNGDIITNSATNGIGVSYTSGSVSMQNTQLTENGSGGACFNITGSPAFNNLGGNTINCSNLLAAGSGPGISIIADGHSAKGACTGTATAASTLGLYGTGPNVTLTTCTSTTIGSGMVVSGARVVYGLVVTAGTGGVNASSGVVTVLQNGVATSITCTLGTGTNCNDGTHTFTTADGDRISLQFTTQAADTLANVKVIIAWN